MNPYPKIETLYERNQETFKVTDKIRRPEFTNIRDWLVTEKIDGTNIRVAYSMERSPTFPKLSLEFKGRTNKAQIPSFLLEKLQKLFPIAKLKKAFEDAEQVCLYGEGYGPKIQKGGGNYRKDVSFRLFDVWIDGWWLEWESIEDIAKQLEIETVYNLGIMTVEHAVKNCIGVKSFVARDENNIDITAEGIVARAYPRVLFRRGNPVMWKLKVKDF